MGFYRRGGGGGPTSGQTASQVLNAIRANVRDFQLLGELAADQALATGAVAGTWTSWTSLAEVTIGGGMAGRAYVHAHAHFETAARGTSGGDRFMTETEIMRERGGNEEIIEHSTIYGPRNGHADFGASFADATRLCDTDMSKILEPGECQVGDIFRLRARCMSQQASRTLNFTTDGTFIEIGPLGR